MGLRSLIRWPRSHKSALREFEAAGITAAEFGSQLLSKGAVLIRRAVPDDVILPLGEEIERMIDHFDKIPME